MRSRRIILAVLLTVIFCLAAACKGGSSTPVPVGVLTNEKLYDGNVNLNIYAVQDDQFMRDLFERFQLDMFKTKAAGVTVTWFDSEKSLIQTVTTEMMGGGGPDVLFFYPDTFESSYNLMKNNMFTDLNPVIEELEYNLDNLNPYVTEAGVYDSKRLFMPINYYVDMFVAVDAFQEVSFKDITSMEEFMEAHEAYVMSKPPEDRCFNFSQPFTLPVFLELCNIKVVDFKAKEVVYDEDELKRYVDWYKMLRKNFIKDETDLEGYSDPAYGPVLEGDMVFMNNQYISNHNNVKWSLSLYKALTEEEEAMLYSFSDLTSGTSTAYVGLCGAVNRNSRHPKEAYELIKCALSKSMQENRRNSNIPVRNTVLDFQMLDLGNKTTFSFDYDGTTVNVVPMTEKEEATFRSYIKEPGNVIVSDLRYYTIMMEAYAGYINGYAGWEETMDQVRHRLMIYIHE